MTSERPRILPALRNKLPDPRPVKANGGICGFCWTGTDSSHEFCRRGIRNGDGSIIYCECEHPAHENKPTPMCLECYHHNHDEVDPKLWLCWDATACGVRVRSRLEKNVQYMHMEELRARSTERAVAEGRRKPPREKKEPRSKVGACLCCGEPTAGGKFQPGHDARLVSIWAGKVAAGSVTREDAITKFVELGTSDALVAKLTRKLDNA